MFEFLCLNDCVICLQRDICQCWGEKEEKSAEKTRSCLNVSIFECWNFEIFEHLNVWIFKCLNDFVICDVCQCWGEEEEKSAEKTRSCTSMDIRPSPLKNIMMMTLKNTSMDIPPSPMKSIILSSWGCGANKLAKLKVWVKKFGMSKILPVTNELLRLYL